MFSNCFEIYFIFVGIPAYFVASLLEMSDWGGTDAESLKRGVDSIFIDDGKIQVVDYQTKLMSLTIIKECSQSGKPLCSI